MGALCGPLWERCCCRDEERPGDLQQMAPDGGDSGWSASAGIPAEPQVSGRRRAPVAGTAAPPPPHPLHSAPEHRHRGSPSIPAEHPAPWSFLPRAASSFYCSPSYLLFRCVLKGAEANAALQPPAPSAGEIQAVGRGHRLEGVPALQGSPNNLEENKQTYFCMCECVRVCRCVTNIKFPSQSKGQAPCPRLWHTQAPGRGRSFPAASLSCPCFSSQSSSLWQGEEEEEAEARGEGLCPWSEFLSPHIRSFWELRPVPGEDGVPGPGLCMV